MNTPSIRVSERIFMLDCGRKYFTPKWIKKLINEISAIGYNVINIHFADLMGIRLESKKYPWLAGGDHTLCSFGKAHGMPENNEKYLTQDEMRDIVIYAKAKGMDVIPSLDTPGHMTYAIKKYKSHCGRDIGASYQKNGMVMTVSHTTTDNDPEVSKWSKCIDISNPEAIEFAKNLYIEYGLFFHALGCTSFDIGGDELLGWGDEGSIDKAVPKWQNLEHWEMYAKKKTGNPNAVAYDAFILYMNEIASLLRGIGYKSIRMWNDDVYRITDTGWRGAAELDRTIDVQYWCPLTNNGANSAKFYLDKGHNIYNFTNLYTYYTLYPEESPSRTTPEVILKEWNPYLFAPNNSESTTDNTFTFPPFNPENYIDRPNERIKGMGFCLWTDCPDRDSEDELLENMRPYFHAVVKKSF